jgi:glycerol-3-phosphate acyltransferase PlsY
MMMAILLIWRHRSNIQHLLAGTEDTIGTDRPEG